jgi:hypothetical protein
MSCRGTGEPSDLRLPPEGTSFVSLDVMDVTARAEGLVVDGSGDAGDRRCALALTSLGAAILMLWSVLNRWSSSRREVRRRERRQSSTASGWSSLPPRRRGLTVAVIVRIAWLWLVATLIGIMVAC